MKSFIPLNSSEFYYQDERTEFKQLAQIVVSKLQGLGSELEKDCQSPGSRPQPWGFTHCQIFPALDFHGELMELCFQEAQGQGCRCKWK